MEDDNLDSDNEFQEEENEHQEQAIKKISPIIKNKKYNSTSQKKSNLILGSENYYNSNSILNTNYIYKPPDLS